ncbi:threonine aldolase family protein [Bogoriella caseilytica]|uniref:L-threonine aldolase n=1 Tax=Bogoriella caseilytica TaxID=56055 RepID=A0A3N2BF25_9MICO|nr:beta-eliminating lyase-related protein [Bogoriella caseilytica]ROR73800.1 L-threonine aldolase [Bogoriella caseilytica]
MTRGFHSDNASGIHPRILEAIARANTGHAPAYGSDRWTAELDERVRELFGEHAEVFPVFNGTGANVLAAQAMLEPWEALIAGGESHMLNDESTAPQRVGGTRMLAIDHVDAKVSPAGMAAVFDEYDGTVHRPKPAALTIAQATEMGTVYSPDELAALRAEADRRGARLHIDGARLANAAVSLGVSLTEAAAGADCLSFGGTKNGLLGAEALITVDPRLGERARWLRKSSTQLASKMRFLSAQLLALLEGDLWHENATRANAAATLLAERLADLGITPAHPVQANAVFIPVPAEKLPAIAAELPVHPWTATVVRAVASFDTEDEDVEALVRGLAQHLR